MNKVLIRSPIVCFSVCREPAMHYNTRVRLTPSCLSASPITARASVALPPMPFLCRIRPEIASGQMHDSKQKDVTNQHVHPAAWHFELWLPRYASAIIYRCIALLQLLYRWQQKSWELPILPRTQSTIHYSAHLVVSTTTDGQPGRLSWCRASMRSRCPDSSFVSDNCGHLEVGTLSDERASPEQSELTNILYCLIWDSPNLGGQVPVFTSPWNIVAQLYPGHWVPSSSPLTTRRATVGVFFLVRDLRPKSRLLYDRRSVLVSGTPLGPKSMYSYNLSARTSWKIPFNIFPSL
jgi:hypothetical protein